jgi:peptidyl-prolyl cis-trans isomerase A (cyclophilin A)
MHRILSVLVMVLGLAVSPHSILTAQTTTPAKPATPATQPAKPATPGPKPATPAARGTGPAAPATPAIKLPPGTYAHFLTSKGSFIARLFPEDAPKTVDNFIGLATGKKAWKDPRTGAPVHRPYFNNVLFHRVIPRFMIQGGDPLGTGMGGPGFEIPDEISPKYRFDRPGLLAMANIGRPNTGGGQFFVTVAPYASLNGHYTVFGEIVDGLDNVVAISNVARSPSDRPLVPVTLKTVTIETVK